MSEIERKYIELYGEFNLTTKLDDAEIEQLLRRVTIEADEINLLYVTETGMKVFARQIEQLLKEKNT